jgi:spore coat protein U-like protein
MRRPLLLLACATVLGLTSTARAATDTGNVTVSATVAASCVISDASLAFGTYDPVGANASADLDAIATFTVSCTGGSSWSIGLGGGQNPTGTTRRMRDGANFLTYEIYRDAARSQPWRDTGAADRVSGAHASTGPQPVTLYGRIPSAQTPPVGTYADIVVATITF